MYNYKRLEKTRTIVHKVQTKGVQTMDNNNNDYNENNINSIFDTAAIAAYRAQPLKDRLEDYAETRGVEICYFTNPDYADAYIGVVEQDGITRVLYSFEKMLDYLILKEGMNTQEALEYIDYNIEGFKHSNAEGFDDSPILVYDV